MSDVTSSSAGHARTLPQSPSMTIATDRPTAEFVGASDDTIGEAVRRARARAATALRTLEGAGVLVIPQVYRRGVTPRFRVTLKVTAPVGAASTSHPKRRANGTN
jgi:flavin-binding protein dodecin